MACGYLMVLFQQFYGLLGSSLAVYANAASLGVHASHCLDILMRSMPETKHVYLDASSCGFGAPPTLGRDQIDIIIHGDDGGGGSST